MDTSHILQPTATVSYSFFSKVKRFIAAMLLADWVLGNAVNVFIQNLNRKGLLGLGGDFQANNLIWGDSIWLNLLHIFILAFTAGLFGFIFGYLSRRVSLSEKIIFTTLYVFIRFIFIGLFSVIIDSFFPTYSAGFNNILSEAFFAITSSAFNLLVVVLGHLVMFVSSIYFMKFGSNVINDPYYSIDKSKNGTLLDIKWFHYLWLFIPIAFYSQIILNLIYLVGHTIVTLVRNFGWTTLLGGDDGKNGNALDVAWGSLFWIFIAASVVVYLMDYLRKILTGETSQHWVVKLLISISIAIVVPFLILWFTSLAG
ncbi:MAG: hypothetical protein Q8K60_09040 [Parachlamydiaceae bacterium]|nr:hypothetical protein [Parachlamydiaceae bacterium]